ncbi:MAG TPA: serine/threonine-protein kinase [Calditrichia bacterium]|nr:serine/threonine-protein kinase [Calditrichia bacterium]
MDQLIGKVVDGYQILNVLGRGGMGSVYKAKDQNLDKMVAIKMLEPRLVENPNFLKRFLEEPKLQAKLDSPFIVRVNAFRKTEAGLFMVMEFVDGITLADQLRKNGPYPWRNALPIFVKLLKAFDHAHNVGIIHRDIKPHNVLINDRGDVKVTDFGLAKYQDTGDLTKTQTVAGTVKYMSPEQVRGLTNVDHRGDIYALGITLYEMLTGSTPFRKRGGADYELLRAIVEDPAPPPTDINPNIPKQLSDIIMKSIAKDREQRYQSAREMLQAIFQFVKGVQSISPEPAGDAQLDETLMEEDMGDAVTATNLHQPSMAHTGTAHQTFTGATEGTRPMSEMGGLASQYTQDRSPQPDFSVTGSPAWPKIAGGVGGIGIIALLVFMFWPGGNGDGTIPAVQKAAFSILSDPAGADVFINDRKVGQTPFVGDTTLGDYEVTLKMAGYEEWNDQISLSGTAQNLFEQKLNPVTRPRNASNTANPGGTTRTPENNTPPPKTTFTLRARAFPSGTVSVNGGNPVSLSSGRTTSIEIPEGEAILSFSHPVYGSFRKSVSGRVGGSVSVNCYFEQEVPIQSLGPDGDVLSGRIFLNDDNTKENTPNTLRLGPGTYKIDILHHAYTTKEGIVEITLDPFAKFDKGLVFHFFK